MIELWMSNENTSVYSLLSDGCHEICYQTGVSFEWLPDEGDISCARFKWKTDEQKQAAIKMLTDLCDRIPPSQEVNHALVINNF